MDSEGLLIHIILIISAITNICIKGHCKGRRSTIWLLYYYVCKKNRWVSPALCFVSGAKLSIGFISLIILSLSATTKENVSSHSILVHKILLCTTNLIKIESNKDCKYYIYINMQNFAGNKLNMLSNVDDCTLSLTFVHWRSGVCI